MPQNFVTIQNINYKVLTQLVVWKIQNNNKNEQWQIDVGWTSMEWQNIKTTKRQHGKTPWRQDGNMSNNNRTEVYGRTLAKCQMDVNCNIEYDVQQYDIQITAVIDDTTTNNVSMWQPMPQHYNLWCYRSWRCHDGGCWLQHITMVDATRNTIICNIKVHLGGRIYLFSSY
jgi:hypothetical protein